MRKQFMGLWGFTIAGIAFMAAALIPMAGGERMNTAPFVLGIAFLAIGAAIRRGNRAAK